MLSSTASNYSNFHIDVYKLKMNKKLAKLKYLPNNFEIIENGDHVVCAVSGKLISLENLNYWNVELQEPYFSYVEAHKKKEAN
jgi:hypothetical protein